MHALLKNTHGLTMKRSLHLNGRKRTDLLIEHTLAKRTIERYMTGIVARKLEWISNQVSKSITNCETHGRKECAKAARVERQEIALVRHGRPSFGRSVSVWHLGA